MLLHRYRFHYSAKFPVNVEKQFDLLRAGPSNKKQREQWLRWAAKNFDHPDHRELFVKSGIVYPDAMAVVPQQHLMANLSSVIREKNAKRHTQHQQKALVREDFVDQGKRLINSFEGQFQKAFHLREKGIKPAELAAFQHRAELRILNRAKDASAPQAQAIRQASRTLKHVLRQHANAVQLPDWYRGHNAASPIKWFINQLARGNLQPAELPIAVCAALEKFEIASQTFQVPITPRGANLFFLVGTIRERWLILCQKKGGIEPGFLMVNILNPDGSINLTLAEELLQLLGGRSQFRNVAAIRSIEHLLTLIDEVREAKRLSVYLNGLQAGRWEQPLYLLKQDYDENYFRRTVNTSGVGRRIEQTNQYKLYQQEKIALKNWRWFNPWRWVKLAWINIKIWGWRKFGQKNVHTHNVDAMVETLCTELFGAIAPGQVQHISLLESHYRNGQPKSMPLCRWQPGLKTFTGAVSGPEKMKQLAKNGIADPRFVDVGMFLILMLLAFDRDGVGSQCQNKGYIERNGQYYFFAFDIGHFGTGINTLLQTLQVDFSFIAPRKFKNLTIFQDFDIVQKMAGVYLLYGVLPESLKAKWFMPEKRQAIESAMDAFSRQNEPFRHLVKKSKSGHCERIFDRYLKKYRHDSAELTKIRTIRTDFHRNLQRIFNVMSPRLGLPPQTLALLGNLQSLCSKTVTHYHGIRQRHLLTVKDRVVWAITPLANNRYALTAVMKNRRQYKQLKKCLRHFLQTLFFRKKTPIRFLQSDGKNQLVMTVTAAELKQLTALVTEKAVRQYKAIYVSAGHGKKQTLATSAARGRSNSVGAPANHLAPLKKRNGVQDKSQTVVPEKAKHGMGAKPNKQDSHDWLHSSLLSQAPENNPEDLPTGENFKYDNI